MRSTGVPREVPVVDGKRTGTAEVPIAARRRACGQRASHVEEEALPAPRPEGSGSARASTAWDRLFSAPWWQR
jgi:hypothetical protein